MEKYRPPNAEYLVICRPSHVQNTGLYKCEAVNVIGNGANEGYLNVLGLYRKPLQHFWMISAFQFLSAHTRNVFKW